VEPRTRLNSEGRLQALPANIKLGWNLVKVTNTQAYYDTVTIVAVKSFIVQAPGVSNPQPWDGEAREN
jgi:hypothetical protein